jgi:hypothetical protein
MRKNCRKIQKPGYKDTLLYETILEFLAKATEIGYVIRMPCAVHGENECDCERKYMFNQDLTPEQIAAIQHESAEDPSDCDTKIL